MAIRRTKIVATIGPGSENAVTLRALMDAGMDMARISLSHGSLDEALGRIERIRAVAEEAERPVGIMADLPGPKVRAAELPDGGVLLEAGQTIDLVEGTPGDRSTAERIAIDHPGAASALRPGDRVVIGDGGIQFIVTETHDERAVAEISTGGFTQGRPGVSMPSSRLGLSAPTARDLELLAALYDAEVDAVAISFVKSAADILRARHAIGDDAPMLVAKVETPEAVDNLNDIVAVADAVMVARGDLGIRCALEDVPHIQKQIIHSGVAFGRPVITATQMLESMVRSPVPTRAEVTDVANAVSDGTSAVMLSGETAVGMHPVEAVATMARIIDRAERDFPYEAWGKDLERQRAADPSGVSPKDRITNAISAAASRAVVDAEASVIIACTDSGTTARSISRYRTKAPIIAVTPVDRTVRQLTMSWGVTPLKVERQDTTDKTVWESVAAAVREGLLRPGEVVAVLVGSPADAPLSTDTLRLVRVR
ncbi:pyruvate kinase [Blastococcus sp. Marseille-P5729]|uniref:pyruvate kinase n=1 Tax=Blastococcus sp. Marseille-P5729 TaxID=2086582 RepID=UPI000D110A93|nr:pyruvate kinase [Blastococcus sp. Marseille-P5729]